MPERWLGNERYKDDQRDVVMPFSVGPRSCIGVKYVSFYSSLHLSIFPSELRRDMANRRVLTQ